MAQNAIVKVSNDTYLVQVNDKKGKYPKHLLSYIIERRKDKEKRSIEDLIFLLDDYFGNDYSLESMNKKTYIF